MAALLRLMEGEAVTTVALDLGYSPAACSDMFPHVLGASPQRYLSDDDEASGCSSDAGQQGDERIARFGSAAQISVRKSMNTRTFVARCRPAGWTALIESGAGS